MSNIRAISQLDDLIAQLQNQYQQKSNRYQVTKEQHLPQDFSFKNNQISESLLNLKLKMENQILIPTIQQNPTQLGQEEILLYNPQKGKVCAYRVKKTERKIIEYSEPSLIETKNINDFDSSQKDNQQNTLKVQDQLQPEFEGDIINHSQKFQNEDTLPKIIENINLSQTIQDKSFQQFQETLNNKKNKIEIEQKNQFDKNNIHTEYKAQLEKFLQEKCQHTGQNSIIDQKFQKSIAIDVSLLQPQPASKALSRIENQNSITNLFKGQHLHYSQLEKPRQRKKIFQ